MQRRLCNPFRISGSPTPDMDSGEPSMAPVFLSEVGTVALRALPEGPDWINHPGDRVTQV